MSSRVSSPLVEVFLLVEQPRQRLSHWSQVLAPLDDAAAPPLARVDAYYDPALNQAIFGLRYEEAALGPGRLGHVVELALLAEIGMIQPAELSEGDRRRFVVDRLVACTLQVADQRTVIAALVELVRRVRAQKSPSSPPALGATMLPRARPAVPAMARSRGATGEVLPLVTARGTRTRPARTSRVPSASRDLALGSVRQTLSQLVELERGTPEATPARTITPAARAAAMPDPPTEPPEPTASRARATSPPPRRDEAPRPSPHVIARAGVHRAPTVLMSTSEARRMIEALSQPAEDAPTAGAEAEPAVPAPEPAAPPAISASYLRNGRWVALRVGSLSLKGAALIAIALPRVDDRVDVALAFGPHRAVVRGVVAKVSTMQETEATGATMFSVTFDLDEGARRQLTALLTAARAAHVTIKPAAPRSTRRYPVEWPVCLGTTRGTVRADALDVSSDGMFVRPVNALALDPHVTFTAVLDDNQPPVSGHARVVRTISESDARIAGLVPGYGLSIGEMAEAERERWSAFLGRVSRRVTKRVLIAASASRLAELEAGLWAGGYATTGGSEPGAVAQLVSAEARPVDAALIDATWLVTEGSSLWVESVFTARNVPYVTVHGDARRARVAIDRLLAVV